MTYKKSLRQSVQFLVICLIVAFLALANGSSAKSDEMVEDHQAQLPVIQTITPDEWVKRFEYMVDVTGVIRTNDGGFLYTAESDQDGRATKIAPNFEIEWSF